MTEPCYMAAAHGQACICRRADFWPVNMPRPACAYEICDMEEHDAEQNDWTDGAWLAKRISSAIRARNNTDALAARDTRVREQALREAAALIDRKIKAVQPEMSRRAQRLAEGKKPGFQYAIHRADLDARMSDRDTILALIEKDRTND